MAETYCGKNCAECAHREALNCPGCNAGPGQTWSGDCQLAKCCRDKGHETCDTCGFLGSCGTRRGRDEMPVLRRKRQNAEAARQAAIAKKAPFLGKWLWLLFLLVIPATIAGIMKNDTVAGWIPALLWPGQILHILSLLAYGLILLKLSSESDHYRTAGICSLLSSAVNIAGGLVSGGREAPSWMLLFTLPGLIVALVGEYQEYTGHQEVLTGVDSIFVDKWRILWKWYIGIFAAMLGSIVVALLSAVLAVVVLLAALIGTIVVSVVKLVYLYRMAKLFREIAAEEAV